MRGRNATAASLGLLLTLLAGCALAAPLDELSSRISGEVVAVQGSSYQQELANYLRRGTDPDVPANTYYAPTQPAYYLTAAGEEDVVAGVRWAIDNAIKVSFRGGGHHQAGVSMLPGALVIDLVNLTDVYVDPVTSGCRFQAGLSGYQLALTTSQYNLHYRVGHASSNGVAGFTLGGGAGWGGLAVDIITGFDVVNVWEYPGEELTIKHVSATSYPELFFALQGAGQMTGAVVAFYADLQPLPPGQMIPLVETAVPAADSPALWDAYASFVNSTYIDPAVERSFIFQAIPGLGLAGTVGFFDWSPDNRTGTADALDAWLAVTAEAGIPSMDLEVPYLDVLSLQNTTEQYDGVAHYSQSLIMDAVTDEVIDVLTAGWLNATTNLSIIIVDYIPEVSKGNADTAFGWRGKWNVYVWAFWTRTAGGALVDGDAQHIGWVQGIVNELTALGPAFNRGNYVNFIDFNNKMDTQNAFPASNWPRIIAAKQAYDPYNLFRELDFYHTGPGGTGSGDAAADSAAT